MDSDLGLLRAAANAALTYAAAVDERSVAPTAAEVAALTVFDESLPEQGRDPMATLALLDRIGSPATMATTGARYFGFVNGATFPVALGTSFLASAWDQNAALPVMSPIASAIHRVVSGWLIDLFELAPETDVTLVTGATMANTCGIAAGRDALLEEAGWDSQSQGLFGAPDVPVIIGDAAHSTLRKSLGLVGLGRDRVIVVPSDDSGRMIVDELPDVAGPALVCAQAGEVNTGAFDPFEPIADWVAQRGGWLHVDGAFGLWAMADPTRSHLVRGLERADSLATDGHKWLNVTYDCGICFVRRVGALQRTFSAAAGYLPPAEGFEAMHHTPHSSQRARQFEVWSVLRTLGRQGVGDLVRQSCAAAQAVARRLDENGFAVLNDVVLNQVLVRPAGQVSTESLVSEIQSDGRLWCGPTQWQGRSAIRISVSSWKTTVPDALTAADAIIDCAARLRERT